MTSRHALRFLVLALLAAGTFVGCRTVNLDSSGQLKAVYQLGEFQMLVNHTAPATAQSTQAAIRQFDLYQTRGDIKTYEAYFEARARNDQRVRIWIAEQNRNQTLVRIRWGEGGDLNKSRQLFEAIERGLPAR